MNKPLHCLLVEDSENDALLVLRQLRMGGYDVTWERVDTAEAMRAALGRQRWDVVIADYTMPRFSGLAALELLKASGKGLPFIIVSGKIGEVEAVAAMKAGAHDYIMKDKLAHLVPAVERELREAVEWRARMRAEAALRESEVRYRALFTESADGLLIADVETRTFKYANPALCRMLGYTEGELRTMSVLDIHPKDAVQRVVAEFEAQARGDKALLMDIPCLRKDGSVVFADINAGKITIDGRPCAVGFFRDITARKRATKALQESEEKFRHLFESSQDAVMILEPPSWRFTSGNPAAAKMFGAKNEEEFISHGSWELSPERQPDGRASAEKSKEMIETALRKGSHFFEWTHRRMGGEEFPADVLLTRMVHGGKVVVQATVRDITERMRATKALQESEQKYRELVEHANSIILRWTRDGKITFLNEFGQKFFGYAEAEILGRSIVGTIVPASESTGRDLFPLMDQIGANPEAFAQSINENMRRNGERVWVAWTNKLVLDEQGQKQEILSIGSDITERKQTEEGIRMSASLLRATLESTADGILVVDAKGKVLDFNKQFGEMWRLPESVLATGQDQKLLDYALEQLTAPEDFLAKVRELYAQPAKESFDTLQFKDGRVFERFSNPQRIGDRIVGRVWSFRDVTKRRQAEARNREQAALLDNANDAIYVTTLDRTILYWNRGAERTYGWTSAEVLNRKTTELFSPDLAATEAITAVLFQQGNWSGEQRQIMKSGGLVEVFSRLTLVRNEQGQPQSIFAINTDITEKKQLEAQFLRAQRLESIGALASGIAHDLNNVLAPILIGAPLLRGMITDQTARQLLKTMETSAQRGAAIVRQVLTFARGVEGERVPVQPRHLLAEMEKLAAETFPKDIRLESDAAADLWLVLGDATQLHQALMNLCINARDAMPGGGVLTLQAANIVLSKETAEKIPGAQPGSFVCLRVTDTGTGIPPEIEAKIFEPFFTTKGVGKGTGLGLSTVLGIVHSHVGFVRVASKVGQGSTFELYLPATKAEQMAAKRDSATPWPHARGEGILVVDDEAAVREVVRQTLMEFGYQVITTDRGVEALKIFRERRQEIQLVLTDMMMPEMDGPTLVAALRALDPAVKIIGTTGMSDTAGTSGLKALEVSAMLAKPFTIDKLLAVIRVVLPVTAGYERTVPDGGASRPAVPG